MEGPDPGSKVLKMILACPDQVARFQSWCTTALGTAGLAGQAPPDGEAGHEMTSGAGGR
jgi:hypothetical protein